MPGSVVCVVSKITIVDKIFKTSLYYQRAYILHDTKVSELNIAIECMHPH